MGKNKKKYSTTDICYWCGNPSTSKEHVPPRCIFKALPSKNQLITVPSCDLHNHAKSADDEYFAALLAINFQNNIVGKEQVHKMAIPTLLHSSGLASRFKDQSRGPFMIEDPDTGDIQRGFHGFEPELDRLNNVFEHIARAIYYHHYKCPLQGSVEHIFPEFLTNIQAPTEAINLLKDAQKHGENPEAFYYQMAIDNLINTGLGVIRLSFYEGTNAIVVFQMDATE